MSEEPECIAIVGLGGRFPKAAGVAEFWENLRAGRECITFFTDAELLAAGVRPELLQHPAYVRANGVIDGIDEFDAAFFGFNPREAEILDPQQRLFLECAWEALEDAACDVERYRGVGGVFAGTSLSTYAFQLYNNPLLARIVNDFQILISNDKDHLATRLAYKLNLRGPAITLGTACSTSLVAVSLACQSLIEYQCDLALAGGVTLGIPMIRGYVYEEGGIASPDGHCRPFDAAAMGTVGGNGLGIVVLKRLSDALAEGDPIRAVIRGWGVNNDGSGKVGYTAPSVSGQAGAIATALAMAGVSPDTITMMEAHGTATPLGDPIEFAALCQAWRKSTQRGHCALGSVKSNVGHMDSAAGVAGLIKCVLALEHRQIPPSLHFARPNPKLDLEGSPFFVNNQLLDWQPACGVRRAAVSSFGIGGTNAHVIVEEAPHREPGSVTHNSQVLVLSARTASALDVSTQQLARYVEAHPTIPLTDIANTLQLGRAQMKYRRAVPVRGGGHEEATRLLRSIDPRFVCTASTEGRPREVAFLFPGQGAQHAGMGRHLYQREPAYRAAMDSCAEYVVGPLGLDIREVIHATEGSEPLRQTQLTQVTVFAVSYALARLWMHWGIRPAAIIGHSLGEYVAACLAGVFTLEEALDVVVRRGQIFAQMPSGAMLAVALAEQALRERLDAGIEIAAVNGPASCVVAGTHERVEQFKLRLDAGGVTTQVLHTSHAFHSHLMDGAIAPVIEAMRHIKLQAPTIPYLSNLTGTWIRAHEAQSPEYWGRHLRSPVRFGEGVGHLLRETEHALLECGPGQTLTSLARQSGARALGRPIVASCRHPQELSNDVDVALQALAQLWVAGAPIDWSSVGPAGRRQRVPLPAYPFERQRYWIDAVQAPAMSLAAPIDSETPEALEDWTYVPRWMRCAPVPPPPADHVGSWVIVGGSDTQIAAFSDALIDLGQKVEVVRSLGDFGTLTPDARHLICLQGIDPGGSPKQGFYDALALLQRLCRRSEHTEVLFVSCRAFSVTANDVPPSAPENAGIAGLGLVAAQEYPQLRCRVIDLDEATLQLLEGAVQAIVGEALQEDIATAIAYRGAQRWMLAFEPAPLAPVPRQLAPKLGGHYLITGGFGRMGVLIAEYLAQRGARTIVLSGRTSAPMDASDPRIARMRAIEALGTRVISCVADTGSALEVAELIRTARAAGGRIDGVFHAAGLTRSEYFPAFAAIDERICEAHFAAKHRGLGVLTEALREDPPGFICLMSSISVVLGGIGFGAYAAANAMLDATASLLSPATRWVSINWDGWSFDGEEGPGREALIHAPEGLEVLERVLAAGDLRQVIVSVRALGPRLVRSRQSAASSPSWSVPAPVAHERPTLGTEFVAPTPGRQTLIAELWRDLLGIESIGAHDNFFELGGHSLLAVQVISRLREALQRDVPVRMLFDHPTVAELNAALDEAPEAELSRLLDRVEAMTDVEVASLVER